MQEIKQYEQACNKIAQYFIKRYFGKDTENWWIADEIGSVLHINGYFFDMKDIVDFIKYKYTRNQMFEYYNYDLKNREKAETSINIKNYKKICKK